MLTDFSTIRSASIAGALGLGVTLVLAGCMTSAPTSSEEQSGDGQAESADPLPKETADGNGSTAESPADNGSQGETPPPAVAASEGGEWKQYSEVPYVPIMKEVDGLKIPRIEGQGEKLQIKGDIPADVGNTDAKEHPGEPTTGGQLVVRFGSEPKTLNPITENSAVQSYIWEYVQGGLAWRDPETLEYEPHIAKKWVAEDSVKLAPDYPGHHRRIALGDGEPKKQLEIDYQQAESEEKDDPVLTFTTSNADGQTVGNVWVRLKPLGEIDAAPPGGYHRWSDQNGQLKIQSIASGKYRVRVGAEFFGETIENDDGSLTITPQTPQNPLRQELQSAAEKQLTLAPDEWIDVEKGTIYTYFLREDVKWSDGEPFTGKDLEFALAAVKNPYVDGQHLRVYYNDLISCNSLDPHTVRMKYRRQYFKAFQTTQGLAAIAPPWHLFAEFFEEKGQTLTLEKLSPEEKEAGKKVSVHGQKFGKFFNTEEEYNLKPLGVGPYIIDVWKESDRVEIRRNPDYWHEKRAGYLDRIVFKFIEDNVTAFQALKAGEIDFLWRMESGQYFEDWQTLPDSVKETYVKASWYSPGFSYYGWNLQKPLFQDRRVRIALSLLFDKQAFLEKKVHGAGVVVSGSQYFFGPAYDHSVKPLGYGPQVAQDLLADAGWVDTDNDGILDKDGQKFRFKLLFPPGSSTAEARAAVIQKSYKRAGIQMEIRNLEWATFIERVRSKDFDAVNLGWATSPESDPYQIWHSSGAGAEDRGSNHVSFAHPLADELIEKMRVTLDKEKRERFHWSFHRILDRQQPYMFLYTTKSFGAYHKRFRGVKWYRLRPGFDFTEWYVPKELQKG